jgi:hypothetical protein
MSLYSPASRSLPVGLVTQCPCTLHHLSDGSHPLVELATQCPCTLCFMPGGSFPLEGLIIPCPCFLPSLPVGPLTGLVTQCPHPFHPVSHVHSLHVVSLGIFF